jgi:hypothetical protein
MSPARIPVTKGVAIAMALEVILDRLRGAGDPAGAEERLGVRRTKAGERYAEKPGMGWLAGLSSTRGTKREVTSRWVRLSMNLVRKLWRQALLIRSFCRGSVDAKRRRYPGGSAYATSSRPDPARYAA